MRKRTAPPLLYKAGKLVLGGMLVVGICSFGLIVTCACLANAGVKWASSQVELPIQYVWSIFVDWEGRIYCFDWHYQRLQVYSRNGNFLRGWFVPANSRIVSADSGVATVILLGKDDKYREYDLMGNLVAEWEVEGAYKQMAGRGKPVYLGWKYDRRVFGSRIVKLTRDGPRTVVKSKPYLWAIAFPIPGFAYICIPALIWGLSKKLRERRSKEGEKGHKGGLSLSGKE